MKVTVEPMLPKIKTPLRTENSATIELILLILQCIGVILLLCE